MSTNEFDHEYLNLSPQLNLTLEEGLDLRQRSNLIDLDRQLHKTWSLGKNYILGWHIGDAGIDLLVVHHYAIADYAIESTANPNGSASLSSDTHPQETQQFVMSLLSGTRELTERQLKSAARLFRTEPMHLKLRQPLTGSEVERNIIDELVQRYGVSYVPNRAVALFDIVEFSLLSPFEQMTQINSLSHSLNSVHSKMLNQHLHIDFARSSTGDGFYVWNRDSGIEANTQLYHLMHLVLADNAIARSKARGRTVPMLRAGFHIGSCYEFYQAEGLNPTIHSDIVGDVTIELARMIEHALPDQILVGEFFDNRSQNDGIGAAREPIDAVDFIELAQGKLSSLNGLELSGDAIESIKCYLTGRRQPAGNFTIRKLAIHDKHGLTRNAFNAKINIYRVGGSPILLGIEDRRLRGDDFSLITTEHIERDQPAH